MNIRFKLRTENDRLVFDFQVLRDVTKTHTDGFRRRFIIEFR